MPKHLLPDKLDDMTVAEKVHALRRWIILTEIAEHATIDLGEVTAGSFLHGAMWHSAGMVLEVRKQGQVHEADLQRIAEAALAALIVMYPKGEEGVSQ